ncbi:BAR adaptor protein Hob3 [Polyrhizophydium stewartii]|uniref:BAR adaptor protein Hob3 n=1 Tax=Polyrhizophydium stewartii TaxID=2732419 RepID=A0ABR4NFI3_9FUNG
MQSAGAVEKTIDKDFEAEERRFKSFETKVERLHKEAKGYLDAVRATTVAQQRVAEVIDNFYDEASPLHKAGRLYRDATSRMDEEVRTEMDSNYRVTVLDPVGRLIGVFPDFNEAIKKRSKKLLDYDRLRSNVRRLVDKPSEDISRLPKAEAEANQARDIYDNINRQLLADIPELINMRVAYLNPSFEAIVKSQLAFNEGAFHKLDAVRASFPPGFERGLEGRVEGVLQQMRELSICRS